MASDSAQRMRWEQVIVDAAVARRLELGATQVDIDQGDESWVVLADPEGNEFCVLSSRPARTSLQ